MKYTQGTIVIKVSGGNKMTIDTIVDDAHYKCFWFDDKKLNQKIFREDEIVDMMEYRKILLREERHYKIKTIFDGT
jgi:uncharacterized protein YodC (DUF2158 family)